MALPLPIPFMFVLQHRKSRQGQERGLTHGVFDGASTKNGMIQRTLPWTISRTEVIRFSTSPQVLEIFSNLKAVSGHP